MAFERIIDRVYDSKSSKYIQDYSKSLHDDLERKLDKVDTQNRSNVAMNEVNKPSDDKNIKHIPIQIKQKKLPQKVKIQTHEEHVQMKKLQKLSSKAKIAQTTQLLHGSMNSITSAVSELYIEGIKHEKFRSSYDFSTQRHL